MFNTEGYSLSDIAAASGKNSCNDSWGGGGAWWIIILFLFVFMGGGWGNQDRNNGGGGTIGPVFQGTTTREEVAYGFDMNNLENGVRSVQNGLCDGFYALNTTALTGFDRVTNNTNQGFAGLNTVIATTGNEIQQEICNMNTTNMQNTFGLQQAINNNNVANMQNTYAITSQINDLANQQQNCCCSVERSIDKNFAETNYNLATQSCQTRQAICDSTRDIIDNQNGGVRAILDFLTQDKIATLQAENQNLKFAASQQAQNAYLVNELSPRLPIPAYTVPNPFASYSNCSCGCSGTCGFN